ncbi:unnamed protein product, partial [Closterium sp. NIES-53]
TSPTLRWTGKVGDASAFRVWGSRAFVRDLSADELSSRAVTCVFLGFPPDAPCWQFYHPTSRRVLSSEDVTFDESVPYYHEVAPVEVAVDSGASRGAEPGCAESGGAAPGGAGSGGAEPGGAEPGGAGSGGAEPERAEPGGAASGGADPGAAGSGGVEPAGTGPGGPSGALSRQELPSPQELRKLFARRWTRAARAGGTASAGGSATTGGTGAGGAIGAGPGGSTSAGGAGATGSGGARTGGTRAAGPADAPGAGAGGAAGVGAPGGSNGAGAAEGSGAGGAAGVGADAGGAGFVPAGSGGVARPRPYFVPLLEQVLGLPPSSGPAPSLECPPPVQSESQSQLASPLPAPSPYAGPTGGLAERREPESRPASPVRTARTSRRVPRPRPPSVPGTHSMTLHPSTAPQRVPLPSPPASSLPALADPASDSLRAASPTVTRLLATVVTDPSFESSAASALVTELVAFAAHCRLDFATSLVAESASVCPPSVGGECAFSTDILEDRQEEFQCFAAALPHLVSTLLAPEGDPDAPDIPTPRSYAKAIEGPYSSQWQAAMDAEMASWKSTGTYVDEVPPPGPNIISGMWIFRVKRPPGSPPVFKARYVARGFSQRQGVDYFQTFSPTPKMTTLRVLLHVAAQCDYELHSLDFSTAFLQGSLHEEIWLRRPPGFTGSFPPGTQWSLRRPVYGLRQAPREWHDTLRTTLAALGFAPSTADPSLFLRTDTLLPPFYILVYDLVSHLRASDARYYAAAPAEFLDTNQPPMFITLYFIVTRLPDFFRSVKDHFLSLDPTSLTVDLLEQHLLQTSAVAVGSACGTPRMPFFEGCSPSPLAPSYGSAAAVDVLSTEDVGAAFASAKHRNSKGKVGRGGGGGSGSGGGGSSGGSRGSGGGGSDGSGGGSGGVGGGGGGSGGSGGSGSGGSGGGRTGAQHGGSRGGQRQRQQRRSETSSPQQLCEWLFQRGASGGSVSCPYVIRTGDRAGQTCRKAHTQHRCFSRLDDAWRAEFGDEVECPHWAELLRSGVAIFDLDYDVILSAMYALSASAEGDCYQCMQPGPGIEAAALGAGESSLPSTTPAEALHTFTLDSGTSHCFFRDSTILTPLPAPVPIKLADPSGGPVAARSSTVLLCLAVPSGSLSGLHLPSFSTNLVSTSGQVAAPCSCRILSHQTLLWHHRLGHPSLPRLRGMHPASLYVVFPGLCLPSHPRLPRPAFLASRGSNAPLLTLPCFPRPVRLQLRERFRVDLPVLRLHFDRGGEFSSDLLRDFCHGEGILQSFTLPDSP